MLRDVRQEGNFCIPCDGEQVIFILSLVLYCLHMVLTLDGPLSLAKREKTANQNQHQAHYKATYVYRKDHTMGSSSFSNYYL